MTGFSIFLFLLPCLPFALPPSLNSLSSLLSFFLLLGDERREGGSMRLVERARGLLGPSPGQPQT